jgi:catechol 2,3-dioxygenase-like lactoylglutathione lyase family enzyme
MRTDRITANLPSRDFAATQAFYAALGFDCVHRSGGWMILERGPLEVEFFPWPDLDPYASNASACVRVDDLDGLYATWRRVGLSDNPRHIPRLTAIEKQPDVPRMFALVDGDGSLLRVLQNGED